MSDHHRYHYHNYRDFTTLKARDYDREVFTVVPAYEKMLNTIVDFLCINNVNGNIVDFGAGTGNLMKMVLDRLPSSRGHLIDYSSAMCKRASEKLVEYENRFEIYCKDIELGPPLDQVAAAICTLVLHEISQINREKILEMIMNSLISGGYLLVGDYYLPDNDYQAKLYAEQIRVHGQRHGTTSEEVEREVEIHLYNSTMAKLADAFQFLTNMGLNQPSILCHDAGITTWALQKA